MDINDVKFLGRKSWSFLSQADLGIISGNCQYARVIEELPNKIICHMYGLNREKFQTRYNMSQNFIKRYEKSARIPHGYSRKFSNIVNPKNEKPF